MEKFHLGNTSVRIPKKLKELGKITSKVNHLSDYWVPGIFKFLYHISKQNFVFLPLLQLFAPVPCYTLLGRYVEWAQGDGPIKSVRDMLYDGTEST